MSSQKAPTRGLLLKQLQEATELSEETLRGIAFDLLFKYFEYTSDRSDILVLNEAEHIDIATKIRVNTVRKFFKKPQRIDSIELLPDEVLEALVIIVKRRKSAKPLVVKQLKRARGTMKPFPPPKTKQHLL